jgi:hypothetical protein
VWVLYSSISGWSSKNLPGLSSEAKVRFVKKKVKKIIKILFIT